MAMTPELIAVIALTAVALVLGVLCVLIYRARPVDLSATVAGLEASLQAAQQDGDNQTSQQALLRQELASLTESNTRHREQISQLQTTLEQERLQNAEKLSLLNDARERMTLEFKTLASDILEDKSRRFTVSNRDSIGEILKPLNEKIQLFEKKVEETYQRESNERFSLTSEIRRLQELNARISEDAINLTNALKGENKTQGTWGEVILESILERSGLVKGREYDVQVSLKDDGGSRLQPDVIVRLPDNKHVIIDSKVSLKSYEAYCSEDDETRREENLRQHLQSLRQHIKSLNLKEYQNLAGINSLDFVFLFMPIEAAFSVALQHDPELFSVAFEKNIVLVGPSTLLATLRTIQNIWRHEYQNRNAIEIASSAGKLYDKFVAFAADLEEIGSRIDATQKSYDKAHNKLTSGRGNLVSRIENLKKLGARATKKHAEQLLAKVDDALEDESLEDESVGKKHSVPGLDAPDATDRLTSLEEQGT